jgi:hypothetical protein
VLRLRTGEQYTLLYNVTRAPDYPIDLYLVMDLSYSMRDDLANLKTTAISMADKLAELTNDYKIGFGSFVEKSQTPFTNPEYLFGDDPCKSPSWGFRNDKLLQADKAVFSTAIKAACISGNRDTPEQPLDGAMQAVVCTDMIGWGEGRRHIMLLITDADFHYNGDSFIQGVYQKNDGQCHMTSTVDFPDGYYDREVGGGLYYLAPSITQFHRALLEHDVIPLIAATSGSRSNYDQVISTIGFGGVGTLSSDSSNVVSLLEEQYELISETVTLSVTNDPDDLVQTIVTHCPGTTCSSSKTHSDVQPGDSVFFNVTVQSNSCLPGGSDITLSATGFGSVTLTVVMDCECSCNDTNIVNVTCSWTWHRGVRSLRVRR